jgi:hypothetical protein
MDRDTTHPLTPEEAKIRLRAAAERVSLINWMSQHKGGVLAAALASGFIAGRSRTSLMAPAMLVRQVVPMLLLALFRKRKGK